MKKLAIVVVALAAVSVVACGGEEAAPAEPGGGGGGGAEPLPFEPAAPGGVAPDPSMEGPYPVGVRTFEIDDHARPKADGSPRHLRVEVWYPAVEAVRGQEGAIYDIRDEMTEEQKAQVADVEDMLMITTAVRDAPPRADGGKFPLVIFGHGQGGIRYQSTYYTVKLASHGYVVAAPDHEGGTIGDLLRNELESTATGLFHRGDDAVFLVDTLPRLRDDSGVLALIDDGAVGLTGHSFGGVMSLRAAVLSDKVDAIVPQTPAHAELAWLGFEVPVILGMPVMIQGGHLDRTLPWDEHIAPTWELVQQPRWLVDIVNGGHFTFSDLCDFDLVTVAERLDVDGGFPGVDVQEVLNDGCGAPAPPAADAHALIDHTAIAFFNAHLRGNDASLALLTQEKLEAIAPGQAVLTADP